MPAADSPVSDFRVQPLGFPWVTRDPFLFCVHHLDLYPPGNAVQGPTTPLTGRNLGMDFHLKDGWRMYHGQQVPGFPAHPHRGFETVTWARQGYIDHSDSLGAAARYGKGDCQWMTAGAGIVHSEMFPLVETDAPNPTELFQIWLNLPAKNKLVEPDIGMLWSPTIPVMRIESEGGATELATVAGAYALAAPPPAPPKNSWANDPAHEVAIWTLKMEPGAVFEIPATRDPSVQRTLYYFVGEGIELDGRSVLSHGAIEMERPSAVVVRNGPAPTEILMLQGRPIGEPVAQVGPFVMNTRDEVAQAFADYERTRFGGWPWSSGEPVHDRDAGRFARGVDGSVERQG